MFSCALCEVEWVFGQNVCKPCRQIRHLMNIYSKDAVLKCLNKCLVIEKFKDKEEQTPELGDETYNKPKVNIIKPSQIINTKPTRTI